MNVILFDQGIRKALLPLTYTRPTSEIRVGILKITEKWKLYLNISGQKISFLSEPYLRLKYPLHHTADNTYIDGSICPDLTLVKKIQCLKMDECLVASERLVAIRTSQVIKDENYLYDLPWQKHVDRQEIELPNTSITKPWHIFQRNRHEIISDYKVLTAGRKSQPMTDTFTAVYGGENIFLEEGATVRASILNAEDAPIYLGRNSVVSEGCVIKGAFALGESAVVNMGAKVRGDSTIGLFSKVGGEISNTVVQGFSNKGHDGFMGNSVLGEWCNLGANTNTSNLKNNYGQVKVWDYQSESLISTGLQFVGLIMGDYSKCSIHTMFNTGTIVGIGANLYDAGFHTKFVPSFAWGSPKNYQTFRFDRFFELVQIMMKRRNRLPVNQESEMLAKIWNQTAKYRCFPQVKL